MTIKVIVGIHVKMTHGSTTLQKRI